MKETSSNNTFLRDLAVIAVLVFGGAWLSATQLLGTKVPLSFWVSVGILIVVSFFIHRFLVKANDKRPQIFVASFMGSLAVKLFLSFSILIAIGFLDNENLVFSSIGYLIAYLLLLVAEVRNLLPLVRSSSR